jgi:2-iminobutanoate/2-iminopropanoate deaminase
VRTKSAVSLALAALVLAFSAACAGAPARRTINTASAPKPVGPYAQAVQVGETLYTAGQIGNDAQSGALVAGGIQAETRQALRNLDAVLDEAGFSLRDSVQVTVYLADIAEFAAMNQVYGEVFAKDPPARATIGVAELPRGARVEISLIAVRAR